MADVQTVVIEFVTNDEQLDSAINKLEKTGAVDSKLATAFKQTSAEISKQATEIKKAAASTTPLKKNLEDVNKATKSFTQDFAAGFNEGVIETLAEAGVSVEEFTKALGTGQTEVEKSSDSLRQRLKILTEQITAMKLAGEDNTEQFKAMVVEAGNIKDAIGDAGAEIKNAAANSQALDGLIGAAQGVAAGFAVAQGAAALFGDDSEELQEVLVRVNSSMAVLQGIQQLVALTQGESAAATFLAATAQKIYNVVVGETIGLMRVLRIAFAATGIGAVILGITVLVQWLTSASRATKQLIKDLTSFNDTIEAQVNDLNKSLQQNERIQAENNARLKERGALQSEINKQEIKDLKSTFDAVFQLEQAQRQRAQIAEKTINDMRTGEQSFNQEALDESQKFLDSFAQIQNKRKDIANEIRIRAVENEKQARIEQLQAISDGLQGRLELSTKNSQEELDLAKKFARAQAAIQLEEAGENLAKRLLIEKELQKQLRDLDKEFARVRQEDRVAASERELLEVQKQARAISERTNQAEIDAQKKVVLENTRLQLLQEGLTSNQKLLIWENYFSAVQQLQKGFNTQSSREVLEDLISRNNAQLANIKLTDKEKLSIQEENIIAQAQIEIDANKGLVDKIKAIRAQLNIDLRALRLAAVEKELEDELSATEVRTGVLRRADERIAANEKKGLNARIEAINRLAARDIEAINAREDALKKELKDKLISQEEYNAKYDKLVDEETKIVENAEIRKRQLAKETKERNIQFAVETAIELLNIIQQFGQQQTEAEQIKIDNQRKEIDALREAGAITEKEAIARQKKLDQEERTIKRKQAERDKAIALFQAIVNTASAVAKALVTGGPVYAAIVGALGAAQITLIASKPIPKFAKGKKDRYEGPGEIGEAGMELMQRDGQLYLAKKRTLVWLGKDDKVYNPVETKEMLMPVVDRQIMQWQAPIQKQPDMKQMAAELAKEIKKMPGTNVSIDENGLKVWVQEGLSRKNYMDKRYSSK
jgi:hypothetical protein